MTSHDSAPEGVFSTESFEAATDKQYWLGDMKQPESSRGNAPFLKLIDDTPSRYGSVSARARRYYAEESIRRKDRVKAAALAFFLGMFGIHKFYLGCNQAAFVTMATTIIGGLFTFGIAPMVMQVISIVEGVLYLSKSPEEFDHFYVHNQRDWF